MREMLMRIQKALQIGANSFGPGSVYESPLLELNAYLANSDDLKGYNFHIRKDENSWFATAKGFECLADSDAGFGDTPVQALVALLKIGPNDLARKLCMQLMDDIFISAYETSRFQDGVSEGAALLAPYLAGKTVPMAMLQEIESSDEAFGLDDDELKNIANKYGYKVV